jgi:hypothetical protein
VEVAGHGFDPGVGHADQGLGQVAFGKADRLEIGACRGAIAPVSDATTAMLEIHSLRRVRHGEGDDKGRDKLVVGQFDVLNHEGHEVTRS